jgi:hypothetical protein
MADNIGDVIVKLEAYFRGLPEWLEDSHGGTVKLTDALKKSATHKLRIETSAGQPAWGA